MVAAMGGERARRVLERSADCVTGVQQTTVWRSFKYRRGAFYIVRSLACCVRFNDTELGGAVHTTQ